MSTAIQPVGPAALDPWAHDLYLARRNVFNFLGIKCRILTLQGQLICAAYLKAFKLKEDITVYADLAQTTPLLQIQARQILDFSAAYDVFDARTGEQVGALRRKGFASLVRDEWTIMDPADQPILRLQEDSLLLALLRRFLTSLIPQNYTIDCGGRPVAVVRGTWNPFVVKYEVDLRRDTHRVFDRRLALAAAVLLLTIEGKQD
jgi:hypothetical protein